MEIFQEKICITGAEVESVIGSSIKTLLKRGKIRNVSGRASYGNPALYPVDYFPQAYRVKLYSAYPELSDEKNKREMVEQQNAILRNILPDPNARRFFSEHLKANGESLKPDEQKKYYNSAIILNALQVVYEKCYSAHVREGKASKFREIDFWKRQSRIMPVVSENYVHYLPWNHRGLQTAFREYSKNNYASLLSKKIGNKNRTKKQRDIIEKIVISIYYSKDKPFISDVTRIYNEFVIGIREIYNEDTGEVFNRMDFYHKGEPITLSDGTVYNILNNPLNRKIVDRGRNDFHYNQIHHNGDVKRECPYYSLSKISMDDRDLRRKAIITIKNKVTGKEEKKTVFVHAYYAFDVASDTCIGAAYSLIKDTNLVMECFRNMWNNLRNWGLRTPYECEVENHLMSELSDKLDRTFMHVTFCAPMNSRQKRSEHKIRAKVWFGEESERALGMAKGRHYGKSESYLGTREKVFDETNDTYKEQVEPWEFDRVIAEDMAHIERLNNIKHTRKKNKKTGELLYEGMTRMQVLVMKQFSELAPLNWRLLCKEWGKCTETSLKKGSTFTVDYREWWLSDPGLVEKFKPNNTRSQAYYIPDNNGLINEIFIYQDERYIDSPRDLGRFQEAVAERTEKDVHIMNEQLGWISSHKKLAKDAKAEKYLGKIGSVKTEKLDKAISAAYELEITEEQDVELIEEYAGYDLEDYAAKALNSI